MVMRTPLHSIATALVVGAICLFLSLMLPCCYSSGTRPASDSGVTDTDTDSDTDTKMVFSYIWIANTGEDTLSKVDTQTGVEVARYRTCPHTYCDPSRTSVNLHGDVVVTNRSEGGDTSSVTKFAASIDDCVEGKVNGIIETSTGSNDILPWGEDECMLWHTELPTDGFVEGYANGAMATAWDGKEDPDTGLGGNVWVGTCGSPLSIHQQVVYKLDGDNGEVVDQTDIDDIGCCYGGVVDGNDGFWVYNGYSSFDEHKFVRVDMSTLEITESISLQKIGHGITADLQGRVWISGGGSSCEQEVSGYVYRYDPADGALEVLVVHDSWELLGIAVGVEKSAGYVWTADWDGTLYKIDQEDMIVVDTYDVETWGMIGIDVDFEGYVWTVSRVENAAYKFDPDTETYITVPVGDSPDTYSDMTGTRLKSIIITE